MVEGVEVDEVVIDDEEALVEVTAEDDVEAFEVCVRK